MRSETQRVLASIDDAGDVVLLLGRDVTVGHRSPGRDPVTRADLTLLGDIDPLHATFTLRESFHGGEAWGLSVEEGASAPLVDGVPLEGGAPPRTLHEGDTIRFGASAAFVVRRPDDASSSLVLDLARGTECHGAGRVVLMGPGRSARVRLGALRRRHILIGGLTHDVEFVSADGAGALVVSCEGGVRIAGTPADGVTSLALALPLDGRIDLAIGAAPDRLPPFGIALAPLGE